MEQGENQLICDIMNVMLSNKIEEMQTVKKWLVSFMRPLSLPVKDSEDQLTEWKETKHSLIISLQPYHVSPNHSSKNTEQKKM